MITHGLNKYIDGNGRLRAWCGSDAADSKLLERGDIDCMSCLVIEARQSASDRNGDIIGRVITVSLDGTVTFEMNLTKL